MSDREAVLGANRRFYAAFADRDMRSMQAVWADAEPVACTHPGWRALIGRDAVMTSWQQILGNPAAPHVRCVNERLLLLGDTAIVLCEEIIDGTSLAATNVFRQLGGAWKMIHHHSGPMAANPRQLKDEPQHRLH